MYICTKLYYEKMKLSPHTIELLGKICEREICTPADCNILSLDIESKTRVHIGATTLKRLIGFTHDEREPHTSTLDAIARYLGYKNWNEYSAIADNSNSTFDAHKHEVRSTDLSINSLVEVYYQPDRKITFKYLGNSQYDVAESINSKLPAGATVKINNFVLHHPLFIDNVWVNDCFLGQYTAGIVSGLSSVKVIENN